VDLHNSWLNVKTIKRKFKWEEIEQPGRPIGLARLLASGLFYHIGQLERPQFSAVLWRCAVYAEIVVVDNDDRIAAHERQAFHLLVRIFESSQIRALAEGV
jgi:hypothetical protein